MRIGIVNDTPFAVMALRRTLAQRRENRVIWDASNGAEAVALCARDTPDLVLMDLIMPVMDGVEATRRIMASTPCAILIVTASVGTHTPQVFEAMGRGALDAVNTPVLGMASPGEGAAAFLAKIQTIGKLIGKRGPVPAGRAAPPEREADRNAKLVAIGASAGGPTALATVLGALPRDFPAAVVVVQHVDEHFAAGMAEWLTQRSALQVRLARDGERLAPGCVLLAGAAAHLQLNAACEVGYTEEPRDLPYSPSIDVLFNSVCEHWPGQAAGVLLTGMGNDGARGLKSLRDKGHYTVAQDQATSAVYGMPKAAAALDAAVDILPITRIAPRLAERMAPASGPIAAPVRPRY